MLIDTGAANSWVMGSDCSTIACNTHSTFGKADSPSLQVSQEPFSLNYGTGSVNGIVVTDVVGFADKMLEWSFGSASKTSEDFDTIPIDGILGLGRAKSNVMGVPTFMEAVSDANLFSANLFGVHLQREADGSIDGEINFGHPDTTKYTGDLSYTDTIADGANWEIPVDDAFVNGFSCGLKGNTAIIDTGTSFILLPPDDAKQINAKIPGFKQVGETYHIPCDANVSIQIVFSSIGYSISPKDYIGKPVTGSDLCSSNIIGEAIGDNQWLLGDTFLKNVYAVFDIDQSRIGKPWSYWLESQYLLIRELGFGVKGTISFTSGSPSTSMFSTISSTSTETHLSSAVISKTTPSSSKMTTSAITAAPVSLLSESAALANPTSTNTADLGSSTSSVPTTTESSTPRSSTSSINPSATTLSNGITAKSVSDHRRLWLALLLLQLCMIKFI